MKQVKVTIWPHLNKEVTVYRGSPLLDLVPPPADGENPYQPLVAKFNNELVDLHFTVKNPGQVKFMSLKSPEGMETYRRSANLLLCRAFLDVYRNGRIAIGHSLGNNYYYDISIDIPVDSEVLDTIKSRMQQIIENREDFLRISMERKEAISLFAGQGLNDKVRLLETVPGNTVDLYSCGNFYDLDTGPLIPDTSYLKTFTLRKYEDGIVLSFPDQGNPLQVSPLKHYRKLFKIYQESKNWRRILKINNIGRLNEFIQNGKIHDYIKTLEVLHEKKTAQIADVITQKREDVRMVLIAGPSSSGKTTFSKRLAVHLRVNGIDSMPISLDNYFLARDQTPRDENGDYDFESIYALDLELFNQHLVELIRGEVVEVPKFDFEAGCKRKEGTPLRVAENQVIIIEGIHGLNDLLTQSIPQKNKFKIYISALTQVSIDDFNRIHTTDTRLLRRIVRDQKYRGYTALDTLKRWQSVRKGEDQNIFPYQENADMMFNSSVIYEMAVLKKYAYPLLKQVPEAEDMFSEAKRLILLLEFFRELEDESDIPPTSILREFIGGSSFHY
ncbi:MAG: nucleoside kinase [Candidatus Wallbacteria bacterium]|nr:nucleoside kinase [Candidatus Wallbacteria bacterium]